MIKKILSWALTLVAALSGLVASSLLVVDYVRTGPVFCEDSGCDAMKQTVYAHPLGVPLPAFGMLAFATVATLALLRGKYVRVAALGLSASMALVAGFLLGVQKTMGQFCPFCVVTDVSAIVALSGVALRYSSALDPPASISFKGVMGALIALAMVVPIFLGARRAPKPPPPPPPGLPEPIAKEIAATPPEKVCVVDFVDFECPFCRATHEAMTPVAARHSAELRVVRKQVPLRMHPHARDAAKAALCAEELGRGEPFAQALFSAPVEKLTPDECENMAVSMQMDRAKFHACVSSPRVEERLTADTAMFKAVHGHGLPTIWIDTEELKGQQDENDLEGAIARAFFRKTHPDAAAPAPL